MGHHANLYPHPAGDKKHSSADAVGAFLAAGVPARELVLWSPDARVFVSYEDPESLRAKCRYIRDHGLAGAMFWEYYADRGGVLLGTLFGELRAPQGR